MLLTGVVMVVPNALAQPPAGSVVPGSFICLVDDAEDAFAIGQAAVQATGGTLGHVYTHALNGFSIRVPPGIVIANLRARRGVIHVEPDMIVHTCYTIPTGVNRIDAEGVLDAGIDCSGVGIAIIDTGIQRDHPDLKVIGGQNCISGSNPLLYDDDNGHGTHCAGIAAAKGPGIVGVAPGARLYAVKVLNASGSGSRADVIAGIEWVATNAVDLRIHVANMSLGGQAGADGYFPSAESIAIEGCYPVKFAVAAGNDGGDIYGRDNVFNTKDDFVPAAFGGRVYNVFTISAMYDTDGRPGGLGGSADDSFASFSNHSWDGRIALIMPGVNIRSTYLAGGYATKSGTSMASPHAAGLFALETACAGSAILVPQGDTARGLKNDGDRDGQLENLGCATYALADSLFKVHVGSLTGEGKPSIRNKWQATVTITVRDWGDLPVVGATVTGDWSNRAKSSATTGAGGVCTVSSGSINGTVGSVMFKVTGVSLPGYVYEQGSGAPTCTVYKP
jgi:hypothetical protein